MSLAVARPREVKSGAKTLRLECEGGSSGRVDLALQPDHTTAGTVRQGHGDPQVGRGNADNSDLTTALRAEGRYELVALPTALAGADASPVRAALRTN